MDVSRRHRVPAGSGGHSMFYPEGTLAIFPLVTQGVFLEFEMTLTPSKTKVQNAKIEPPQWYVICILPVVCLVGD